MRFFPLLLVAVAGLGINACEKHPLAGDPHPGAEHGAGEHASGHHATGVEGKQETGPAAAHESSGTHEAKGGTPSHGENGHGAKDEKAPKFFPEKP